MKANPMPAVVGFMAGLVDGIDVASAGELKVALDAGADPLEVSFAGPGKRDAELRQAVACRVLVNVESFREVVALQAISSDLGLAARVAVRVNPDFELKGSGMKMGGGPKQFGVDVEQMPELLAQIGRAGLAFEGFHLFAGSQNLRADSICEAQQKSYDLAVRLAEHAPMPVKFLNLGGGFGIPYFPGEKRLDLAPIGENLERLVSRAKTDLPHVSFVIELGRYLVGEAGVYVARIVDRKVSRGQVFLVSDGGLHHHLSASGNFGQVVRKNYPVTIGNRVDSPVREVASVVGVGGNRTQWCKRAMQFVADLAVRTQQEDAHDANSGRRWVAIASRNGARASLSDNKGSATGQSIASRASFQRRPASDSRS